MQLLIGNLRGTQELRLNTPSESQQTKRSNEKSSIESLPKEILEKVVNELSSGDVMKLANTNKLMAINLREEYQSSKLEKKSQKVNFLNSFEAVLKGIDGLSKYLQVRPAIALATRIPVLSEQSRVEAKEALNMLLGKHAVGSEGRKELDRQKHSDGLAKSVSGINNRDLFKSELAEITAQSRPDLQVAPLLALRSKLRHTGLFSTNRFNLLKEAADKLPKEYRQANPNLIMENRPVLQGTVVPQVMQASAAQASARIAGLQAEQIIRRTEQNVVTNLQDRIVLSRSLPENFHEIRNTLSRENRELLDFVQNQVALERQNYISEPDRMQLSTWRFEAGERAGELNQRQLNRIM